MFFTRLHCAFLYLCSPKEMTLIQSISGIRGTIGGLPGEGLSPLDVMRFSGAYGMWLRKKHGDQPIRVIIGRDARISGPVVSDVLTSTLRAMGIDVIDAGLTTTPTIEMAVIMLGAHGGVVITASHNPKNWNALKLLNEHGEFMTKEEGEELQMLMTPDLYSFVPSGKLGRLQVNETLLEMHIEKILDLELVDTDAIAAANFRIAVDGINSSGGIAIPLLLQALGVRNVYEVFCEPTGLFQHNPEPLEENLSGLSEAVVNNRADLGFAVDPDVDRLAIVCEDGEMFGEEYTLVAVADYVLSQTPGNTVSNLSSTQALAEVTAHHGGSHFFSAVGEVNVVEAMKSHKAVIGGEGNGGVIYPELHYGRDALVGVALFLTHLARKKITCSRLKTIYPRYHLSKNKVELPEGTDLGKVLTIIAQKYKNREQDRKDGLKILFDKEWVHLRKSNTEPVIRIYAESDSIVKADNMAGNLKADISEALKAL